MKDLLAKGKIKWTDSKCGFYEGELEIRGRVKTVLKRMWNDDISLNKWNREYYF